MKATPETYALAWVLDRLTSGCITQAEIDRTADETRKAIQNLPNSASSYVPNKWDQSYELLKARSTKDQ